MNDPLISIIIPIYNAAGYLPKCLDGILHQTFQDFEVILVDDGSRDGSPQICDDYAARDARFRVIHKPNEGVSASRNRGLDEARGEWICFMDSDDWVKEDFLENFEPEGLAHRSMLVEQGFFHYHETRASRRYPVAPERERFLSTRSLEDLTAGQVLTNGYVFAKLFRKDLIERNGIRFNTALSIHEDHIFVWDYLRVAEEVHVLPGISYFYLKKDGHSLSSRQHSCGEWLYVADQLIRHLQAFLQAKGLADSPVLDPVWHEFGLNQLMRAVYRMRRQDCRECVEVLFRHREELLTRYEPRKPRHRIILALLRHRCPAGAFYLFAKTLRFFRGNVR